MADQAIPQYAPLPDMAFLSPQKPQILIKYVKQHIPRANRYNLLQIKEVFRPCQYEHRNHLILGAENDLQIWDILGRLAHLFRIDPIFHLKFERESPVFRDDKHISVCS